MLRFVHSADLHLDSPMIGLSHREGFAAEAILGASRQAFINLVDLAICQQADFVLIAGDVFDRDWKGYETGLFFRKGLLRLTEAGIRICMISGNHDAASVISRKLSLPQGVHRFSSLAPETFEPEDLPVAIHGMSFPHQAVVENLVPRYPNPISGKFNIGLLHTSLTGAAGHDNYAPCSVQDLANKGYDYWALGHVHQPQIISNEPWIVFPGNIQGRSIKECGERGCHLVTVDDTGSVTSCLRFPLDVARWAVVTVDCTGLTSVADIADIAKQLLADQIKAADDRILATRVVVTGTTALHAEMHSRPDHLEAEILARASELGENQLWIEQVKLATSPVITLENLAKKDEFTRMVVESLTKASAEHPLPPEISAMLNFLPPSMRDHLLKATEGASRSELLRNAAQLVLHRLTAKGSQS